MNNDKQKISTNTVDQCQGSEVVLRMSNYDILQSGTVIIPWDEYVDFDIKDMHFRFKYEPDKNTERQISISIYDEEHLMSLTFTSMAIGSELSLKAPVELATINDKKIYITFVVKRFKGLGETSNLLMHYTWLKQK